MPTLLTMDDHMLMAAPNGHTIDDADMLAALTQDLRLAEARGRALERELANRDADIGALEAKAAYAEHCAAVDAARIAHLERHIAHLDQHIAHLERHIVGLEHHQEYSAAEARLCEAHIAHLEQRSLVAEQRGDDLDHRIMAMYRSTSWRLTGPMRRLMRLVRR
jgi:hypothetical protein